MHPVAATCAVLVMMAGCGDKSDSEPAAQRAPQTEVASKATPKPSTSPAHEPTPASASTKPEPEPKPEPKPEPMPTAKPPAAASTAPSPDAGSAGSAGVELSQVSEGPRLNKLTVAKGLEKRDPVEETTSLVVADARAYCWMSVNNNAGPDTSLTHVWRYGDKVLYKKTLKVGRSPTWRSYSVHRLDAKRLGDWSCEVLSEAGTRLGIARFTVQ